MERELVLPDDFYDYEWEVEQKGVFWQGLARLGDVEVPITFYDPVRIAQDISAELEQRPTLDLRRVLVIPAVTEAHMRAAIAHVPMTFFE